ncbi:Fur family ferric uptake transcriptional regulator [Catenibacillus scindens]|uniref:Fur family ferric uptake transcriptional regulator n=1 Tax=Catenibacillus scindens TaxID=673271 RepID=A0A7W8M553_9FIRM|nr:transcriptional repressor [Catenibacillus scindens]MBB5264579.1 Fur family ferric uptake transcriptional regulator [Catenibacillus scindens]
MPEEKCQRNTHQKAVILEYIKAHGSGHIRAEDILTDLSIQGESVGKATVYRFLKVLEAEGQIRRYTISDKVPACYQYIGDQPECRQHCHLMCTCCGQLFHVENPLIREFVRQTMEKEGFCVDESKTVFYGLCRECRIKEGGE